MSATVLKRNPSFPVARVAQTDFLTVLYPVSPATHEDTGEHPGKRFDAAGQKGIQYNAGRWFRGERIAIRTAEDVANAIARIAAEGRGFVVLGDMLRPRDPVFARRKKDNLDGIIPGLRSASHRVMPLDLDKIPNIAGADPRVDGPAAAAYLLSLLPPAFADVAMGYDWSSSTCRGAVGAPETLGAHFWPMLDTTLPEAALRAIYKRLSAYVVDRLIARGHVVTNARWNPVDPKIADAQQPIYVVPPIFAAEPDPLPGNRRGFLEGTRDVVCLADLEEQLAVAEALRAQPTARRAKKAAAKVQGTARTRKSRAVAKVVPLELGREIMAAAKAKVAAGGIGYQAACYRLFQARAVAEAIDLVRDRVARGGTETEWSDWHRAGGVPEGLRYTMCTPIAALVVAGLPDDMLDAVTARRACAAVLRLVVSQEWLEEEWFGQSMDADIIERVERDARGETVVFRGQTKCCRLTYGKERVTEELMVGDDEVVRLGLRSLASERARSAARREESGADTRDEYLAYCPAHAQRDAIIAMAAEGKSANAIAATLGIGRTTVQTVVRGWKAAGSPSPAPTAQPDAPDEPAAPAPAEDVEAVVARILFVARRFAGVYTDEEIADEAGADLETVTRLMRAVGLLDLGMDPWEVVLETQLPPEAVAMAA